MSLARRLYRLQARLSLTGPEAAALLVLSSALALGLGVRQLQGQSAPPAAHLAASDSTWALLTAAADSATAGSVEAGLAEAVPAFETRIVPADSVIIPSTGFADRPPAPRRRTSANSPVRMNLNTADAALLQRLPRIGPALAGRIIAYRQEIGPFARVEDVVNVRGIGPKTLEQVQPWLYVE
ncbi:MAG: helix-hairpin-helix domain-containing protein [Rubricoccaceae bacterium]|nr:helix-hairpin-helix domain-containing protein [Rubricoccaceae bacterium]